MTKKKMCKNCGKRIFEGEKQIQLIVRNKGEIIANEDYHWKCWIEKNKKVMNKTIRAGLKGTMRNIVGEGNFQKLVESLPS